MITLSQAIEQIKKANPIFGALLDSSQTVNDFCQEKILTFQATAIHKERQKGYLQEIKNEIIRLFPNGEVRVNLDEELILDTTEHHNLLNFPAIIGAHLITRWSTIFAREKFGDFFVLDTSNVPFTEVLHKRGVEFAGQHINLYPKKDRNKLVSHYPLFKFDLVKSAKNSGSHFTVEEMNFLEKLNTKINAVDLSSCQDFSDQVVKVNLAIWEEFFPPEVLPQVRKCVTLDHNCPLIRFMQKFFLEQKNNFVWRALFNQDFRQQVLQEFSGVYGAWDYGKPGGGTHFFWGITPDGRMTSLFFENNFLRDRSKILADIPMNPESITKALQQGIIVPSIFTKFSLVAFYLGAQTMGGPGQSEYLPKIKKTWLKILASVDPAEANLVNLIPAEVVNTFDMAFYWGADGNLKKAWGFDVAFKKLFSEEYLKKVGTLPLRDALRPFVPLSYYRLTPAAERQKIDFREADLYAGFGWVK
ncbi:MAG: hypothetical protein V1664_04540 [Candidatus Uhrbacteria bacterium]